MTKYEFTLILKDPPELTEDVAERLFEAGCDDGTPGTCCGIFSIDFHRDGNSLEQAIASAVNDVRAAGFQTEHVEIKAEAVPQIA